MAPRGQILAFVLIYISYVAYYIAQKNYTFWLQALIDEEGWNKEEVGAFGSAFQMSSGISKLLNGPLVDSMSSTTALAGSLLVISACNGLIFHFGNYSLNVSLWAINGVFQGVGWPALARIFIAWFPDPKTRGTWYSILSTNQNVGSTLVPLLLPVCMSLGGWRYAVLLPSAIALVVAVTLFLFLKDSPRCLDDNNGSVPARIRCGNAETGKTDQRASSVTEGEEVKKEKVKKGRQSSTSSIIVVYRLVLLGLAYFFISIIRQGIGDWSTVALKEEKGFTRAQASQCLVMLEVGAFIGGLAGGIASDKVFQGRRGPIMCIFSAMCAPIIYAAFCMELEAQGLDDSMVVTVMSVLYWLIGFFSFAPHVLIGLFARELAPANASTAGGFVKAVGQMGGAFAGAPLSKLVGRYGWGFTAQLWISNSLLAAACFVPLWSVEPTPSSTSNYGNSKSYDEKDLQKKKDD